MNQSRRGHAAGCRADAKDPLDGAYAGLNGTLHATHVASVGSPFQVPHPLADANDVLHVLVMLLLRPSVELSSCHCASALLLEEHHGRVEIFRLAWPREDHVITFAKVILLETGFRSGVERREGGGVGGCTPDFGRFLIL